MATWPVSPSPGELPQNSTHLESRLEVFVSLTWQTESDLTTEDNQHYLCFINSQVTTAESFNITIKWFSFEIIDWLQFLSSFLQLQSILTGTSKYINFRIKQLQKIHQKCNRKNWTLSAALIITQNFNYATSPNSFYWFLYWMYIVCKAKNVSIFSSEFL